MVSGGERDGEPSFISKEGGLCTGRAPIHILSLPPRALSVGRPWLRRHKDSLRDKSNQKALLTLHSIRGASNEQEGKGSFRKAHGRV